MAQMDMEFRPAPPTAKALWPVSVFGLLLVLAAVRAATHPGAISPLLLGVGATLIALGGWLVFRLRFPGSPRLRVSRDSLTYTRNGRARTLLWAQVASIRTDFIRRETRIIPTTGERPIIIHPGMISTDGKRFDGLIERWWKPGAV